MMSRLRHSAAGLAAWLALAIGQPGFSEDAQVESPAKILQSAFSARYDCTLSGIVEISARKGEAQALHRKVHVATKLIADRLHTYAQFQEPEYIRGMAFLGIEPEDPAANDQRFVYLPTMRRIRRVGGGQSSDSFLGTDLSYHDFERQHAHNYKVAAPLRLAEEETSEPRLRLQTEPLFHEAYARVDFDIAERDRTILGTRYFKRGSDRPYKVMAMPRAGIQNKGHCRMPSLVEVIDHQRATQTRLQILGLRMDAPFEDSLFSMTSLETSRDIPGMRGK